MLSRIFLVLSLVVVSTLLLASNAVALDPTPLGTLTLAWDPSPDPTVVGYELYQGVESLTYTSMVDVGNADTTTITGLIPGATYFFAVTAYDSTGLESTFSGEISYTVPTSAVLAPGQLGNVTVSVNADGQLVLSAIAPAGYVYSVLATQDFASWTSVGTVTAGTSGDVQFTDPLSPFYTSRFYRLQQVSTQSAVTTSSGAIAPQNGVSTSL